MRVSPEGRRGSCRSRTRFKHPLKKVARTFCGAGGDRLSAEDRGLARSILHAATGVGFRFYIGSIPGLRHVGALGHLRAAAAGVLLVAILGARQSVLEFHGLDHRKRICFSGRSNPGELRFKFAWSIASVRSRIRVAIGAATEPPCSPPCTMTAIV